MNTLLFALALSASPAEDHPLMLDRTGLQWALPFEKALERAEQEDRLLLIKPVAFGTDRAGGW